MTLTPIRLAKKAAAASAQAPAHEQLAMNAPFSPPGCSTFARRRFLRGAAGAAATLAVPWTAAQSAWPTRPITIVVPFPSGGGTDTYARPFTAMLTKSLGNQVIIENRGGAGGTVGAAMAAKAPPDGYTFFMGSVHHTIAPAIYPKLDYNIETDFVPVGLISSAPQVIVINP